MWEVIKRFFSKKHKKQAKPVEQFGYLRFTFSFEENMRWCPAKLLTHNQHWPFKNVLISTHYDELLIGVGLTSLHTLHTLDAKISEFYLSPGLRYEGHILLRDHVLTVYVNNLLVSKLALPPGSLNPKKPKRYIIQ